MHRLTAGRVLVFLLLVVSGASGVGIARSAAPPAARRQPLVEQAVAAVSRERLESTVRRLVEFGTRHSLSDTLSETRGIGAARRWVHRQFEELVPASNRRLSVAYDWFTPDSSARVPVRVPMASVVATLRGTAPAARDRVYVISAHLDNRAADPLDAVADAPGANDDGSGVAVVLEAARVLAGLPLDATVVFAVFSGEEQGLFGSAHFAGRARERNLEIAGVLNNDMVGNSQGGNGVRDNTAVRVFSEGIPGDETPEQARVRAIAGGENDGPSRQLARQVRRLAGPYLTNFDLRLVARRDRFGRGGDHSSFNAAGYPAVRLTEPNEDYSRQHQDVPDGGSGLTGDVPAGMDFDFLAQVARANVAALAGLALAPAPPEGVEILTGEMSYDTALRWQPSGEEDVIGYAVTWRATTSPDWERERFVGNVTRCRLAGLSKDDWIFGVRAVDRDGNESPAVCPVPVRE